MRERSCREEIWPSWSLRNTVQRQEDPVRSPQASHRIRSERLLSLKGPRWAALSSHARVILPTRSPVRCPLIPRPGHPPYPFPRPAGSLAFCFLTFGPPLAPLSPGLPGSSSHPAQGHFHLLWPQRAHHFLISPWLLHRTSLYTIIFLLVCLFFCLLSVLHIHRQKTW